MASTTQLIHIVGTDTGIGKSHVLKCLTQALRHQGETVWIHKPIACGEWDAVDRTAEDGRHVAALCADGQNPATTCPLQFPLPISPHLAALAEGADVPMQLMTAHLGQLLDEANAANIDWLIVEGAGGLCSPLSTDNLDQRALLQAFPGIVLLVARPDLGTINHTTLTAAVLAYNETPAAGLVINHWRETATNDPAPATAAQACCTASGLKLWQEITHGSESIDDLVDHLRQQVER